MVLKLGLRIPDRRARKTIEAVQSLVFGLPAEATAAAAARLSAAMLGLDPGAVAASAAALVDERMIGRQRCKTAFSSAVRAPAEPQCSDTDPWVWNVMERDGTSMY